MQNDGKVKFHRNPKRGNIDSYKPYVPQYQQLGLEPTEYKSSLPTVSILPKPSSIGTKDIPKVSRPIVRSQPYAEVVPSPIGRGRGPLPNVGNNMEQTWSSVDGEIVDDLLLDTETHIIDNNEFVSAAALGLPDDSFMQVRDEEIEFSEPNIQDKKFLTEEDLQNIVIEDSIANTLGNLDEDDYILFVAGVHICSGTKELVEEKARVLIFDEVDDIVVLKKVKIKVGVFLE